MDRRERDADSVALAERAPPEEGVVPALAWKTRPGGRFRSLAPAGFRLGGMNVPVEGFEAGGPPACWDLSDLRGERLTLEILDRSSARWGFVTVRGLALVR